MHRLFLSPEQFSGDTARIVGNDHLHLARVLRARPGEPLILLDNAGKAFHAVVTAVEKTETTARIEGKAEMPPEPPVFLVVAQALGKGDKFETVIQHGTEAGASAFVPVRAERSVVDIPANRVADRVTRWRQIARGAAEQSGRARIAEISDPVTFAEMTRLVPPCLQSGVAHPRSPSLGGEECGRNRILLESGSEHLSSLGGRGGEQKTVGLLLNPGSNSIPLSVCLRELSGVSRLLLAVGPEGGWSPAEVSAARAANMQLVSLGPRILRTETAALVAISQILYHIESLPG